MIVNTQRLFAKLLPGLRIGIVCDVGSMNGSDALIFRNAVPRSSVYAFEPNPENLRRMQADPALRDRSIELVPLAATNFDGEAEFFLVDADYGQRDARCGMSSLYRRPAEWAPAAVVRVGTTRLDTFLADKCGPDTRVALWIDTEGKAFEAIEGAAGVAAYVQVLHVEVENVPCIGPDQKLYPHVKALLERLGFRELATDQAPSAIQFNALFTRDGLSAGTRFQLNVSLARARLRYLIVTALARLCPACVRRYQAARLKMMGRAAVQAARPSQ